MANFLNIKIVDWENVAINIDMIQQLRPSGPTRTAVVFGGPESKFNPAFVEKSVADVVALIEQMRNDTIESLGVNKGKRRERDLSKV